MIKADHQLTLFKNFAIEFTHVPSGKFVLFDGYLEDFSDDYKAQWSANEVYGRSDPILTYKNTTREVTLAWGILANDLTESISNLAKIEVLMSMLYPHYSSDENATIEASPLIKVRFANLAVEVDYTSDEDNADNAFFRGQTVKSSVDGETKEREVIKPVLNNLNGASGLLAAVKGFTYKPDLKNGVFMGNGTVFPRYVPMRCNFTVLHTKPLGWQDSGMKNEISIQFGSEGGNSEWRGPSRWPYGVGGLAQRIPGVPNMSNRNIVAGIRQAKFAAITGQAESYDRDKLDDQDVENDFNTDY
jgi:hypothetical protein